MPGRNGLGCNLGVLIDIIFPEQGFLKPDRVQADMKPLFDKV